MRNFVVGLVLTLAVAASLIVVIDRFQDGGDPRDVHDLRDRLDKLEALLDPRETAPPPEKPDGNGMRKPPGARGIAEVLELCEEIEGMILDSEKSLRRDLRGIYEKLLARIEEMAARGGGSSGAASDDPTAKAALRMKLKEMGVTVHGDEMVEVTGEVLEPSRALELIAVAAGGRAHESLLLIDCVPSALKIGLEDIGLIETESNRETGKYAEDAKGGYVYVIWEGLKKPRRVEDMILNRATNETMVRTPFMFTASRVYTDTRTWERHFAADVYKNVISLTWNFSVEAILACPLDAAHNENIWAPCADTSAPPGTKVRVLIRDTPHEGWDKL